MELTYELIKDDYLAFNQHYIKHSKTVQRSLLIQRFLTPIIVLLVPFALSWITGEFLTGFFVILLILSLVWIVFSPKYFDHSIKKQMQKMLNEENNENMLGLHTFITNEDGFIEKNKIEERKASWSSIKKVDEDDEYFFLYVSAMGAYIVPKRAFSDKDSQEEFEKMIARIL